MNRSKMRESVARFQGRPTEERASFARIWMAASSPEVRDWGSLWAQMNRPKMRGGLVRFCEEAISQFRDRPSRVGEGAACENPALEVIVF